jgi:hypothetical protein
LRNRITKDNKQRYHRWNGRYVWQAAEREACSLRVLHKAQVRKEPGINRRHSQLTQIELHFEDSSTVAKVRSVALYVKDSGVCNSAMSSTGELNIGG